MAMVDLLSVYTRDLWKCF